MRRIVIDNGTDKIVAGYSGDKPPEHVFRNVLGKPKSYGGLELYSRDSFVGDEAQSQRGLLDIKYPVERGIITNFDDMEKIYNYLFYSKMRTEPECCTHGLMLSESPLNSNENRSKMKQIMFETFRVNCLNILSTSTLCLLHHAREDKCLVVESGGGTTHVVPNHFYESKHGVIEVDVNGTDLTNHMMKMLSERDYSFAGSNDRETFRGIKENLSYVAFDFAEEIAKAESEIERNYELPDGQVIIVGKERFRCLEALFEPSILGKDHAIGIHQAIHDSIMACDVDRRKDLYANIVLSGGSTMSANFKERLVKEITALAPIGTKIQVANLGNNAVFYGGSIVAEHSLYCSMFKTKEEYDEEGEMRDTKPAKKAGF